MDEFTMGILLSQMNRGYGSGSAYSNYNGIRESCCNYISADQSFGSRNSEHFKSFAHIKDNSYSSRDFGQAFDSITREIENNSFTRREIMQDFESTSREFRKHQFELEVEGEIQLMEARARQKAASVQAATRQAVASCMINHNRTPFDHNRHVTGGRVPEDISSCPDFSFRIFLYEHLEQLYKYTIGHIIEFFKDVKKARKQKLKKEQFNAFERLEELINNTCNVDDKEIKSKISKIISKLEEIQGMNITPINEGSISGSINIILKIIKNYSDKRKIEVADAINMFEKRLSVIIEEGNQKNDDDLMIYVKTLKHTNAD